MKKITYTKVSKKKAKPRRKKVMKFGKIGLGKMGMSLVKSTVD